MKKKKRLLWQIYPSYLLITIISLVAVSWFASNFLRHFFLDQTASVLETRVRLLEKQIHGYLSPVDKKSVDFICKETEKLSSTRITVILPSGKVVGDSREEPGNMDNHADRPEVIDALAGNVGNSIRYSETIQQNMMYVAVPLKKSNRIIAVLRTSIPVTSIDEELMTIRIRIALAGFIVALIAAGISLFVSRRISRPLEDMKHGAEYFADGDLSYRLPVPDSEELGGLAVAINRMAAQLDDRIKTVVDQRNELEAVLSSMSEGIIAMDREERIISINQAAARMFNVLPSELLSRSIQEAIRNPKLQQFVKKSLSSGKPAEEDIIFYHDGERIMHIYSSPLCDAKENCIGTLLVLNDVTQLRRLENMRSDFAANVSHEIKTPLTAIKGFVETLRNGAVENPEEVGRFLGIIEKHVNRLVAIIEDLINLSRIEQKDERAEIKLEKSRIKHVIQTAIQVCQAEADMKNIKIDLACEEEISARIDPPLLEQAFVNLLDNAVKYSETKSMVQVKAIVTNTEVVISFQDHGIGIAEKHLPRLFERFYRVDKARSRKLGGTGLGLAIVKHIINAHGGHITVESTPGKGSTFVVHLPRG